VGTLVKTTYTILCSCQTKRCISLQQEEAEAAAVHRPLQPAGLQLQLPGVVVSGVPVEVAQPLLLEVEAAEAAEELPPVASSQLPPVHPTKEAAVVQELRSSW